MIEKTIRITEMERERGTRIHFLLKYFISLSRLFISKSCDSYFNSLDSKVKQTSCQEANNLWIKFDACSEVILVKSVTDYRRKGETFMCVNMLSDGREPVKAAYFALQGRACDFRKSSVTQLTQTPLS